MKKYGIFTFTTLICLSGLVGCNDPAPKTQPKADVVPSNSVASPAKPPAPTLQDFETRLLALKECKVVGRNLDYKCSQKREYHQTHRMLSGLGDKAGILQVAIKALKNDSSGVRLTALSLVRVDYARDQKAKAAVQELMKTEKDPAVLAWIIDIVGGDSGKDDSVRTFLLEKADDKDEMVARQAVSWLASTTAKDTKGALAKIIEIIENEKAPEKVRSYACENSYKLESEDLIKPLKKYSTDEKIGGFCLRSLGELWANSRLKSRNKTAYKEFMALLNKKPRTDKFPGWKSMEVFYGQFRPLTEDWYKKDDVVKTLVDIISDKKSAWMTRVNAIRGLQRLGYKNDDFKKLAAKYKDSKGDDQRVQSNLERAASGRTYSPRPVHSGTIRLSPSAFRRLPGIKDNPANKIHLAPLHTRL
jgi:HEAT repeat protein